MTNPGAWPHLKAGSEPANPYSGISTFPGGPTPKFVRFCASPLRTSESTTRPLNPQLAHLLTRLALVVRVTAAAKMRLLNRKTGLLEARFPQNHVFQLILQHCLSQPLPPILGVPACRL